MFKKRNFGFSLLEIMIVVSVFAVLGILVTRSILVTIRGSKKSESQIKVRENVGYAVSVMERQLRSARDIYPCPNTDTQTVSYTSLEGIESTFSCVGGYIASGSARLTSEDVSVDSCSMTCFSEGENYPKNVVIDIVASDANVTGIEKGSISIKTEISTRNY